MLVRLMACCLFVVLVILACDGDQKMERAMVGDRVFGLMEAAMKVP